MDLFNKNTRMTELVHSNYLLLPVLQRFGIQLGFQDKIILDICNEKNIDVNFLLAIVNTFHNHDYFPEHELQSFSLNLIIDYLRKSHSDFVNNNLPKIENLLNNLVESSNSQEIKILQTFYKKYKKELLEHIQDEEENVFPYVLELQKLYDLKKSDLPGNLSDYSIHDFAEEHSDVDEKLFDLKNIIIKYLEPNYNELVCNDFLFELLQFERDLIDHARIEDKILVPGVKKIERELKNGK